MAYVGSSGVARNMTGAYVGKTVRDYVFTDTGKTKSITLSARNEQIIVWDLEPIADMGGFNEIADYDAVFPYQIGSSLRNRYFTTIDEFDKIRGGAEGYVYHCRSTPITSDDNRTVAISSVEVYTLVRVIKEVAKRIVKGYKGMSSKKYVLTDTGERSGTIALGTVGATSSVDVWESGPIDSRNNLVNPIFANNITLDSTAPEYFNSKYFANGGESVNFRTETGGTVYYCDSESTITLREITSGVTAVSASNLKIYNLAYKVMSVARQIYSKSNGDGE